MSKIGLAKSFWTPHIQHTPSLNCYHLVNATELWAPEWPDTETVSYPKQSISWTLDIKHTTILYNYLFTTHLFIFFHFKFAHQTSHIIVCIVVKLKFPYELSFLSVFWITSKSNQKKYVGCCGRSLQQIWENKNMTQRGIMTFELIYSKENMSLYIYGTRTLMLQEVHKMTK